MKKIIFNKKYIDDDLQTVWRKTGQGSSAVKLEKTIAFLDEESSVWDVHIPIVVFIQNGFIAELTDNQIIVSSSRDIEKWECER